MAEKSEEERLASCDVEDGTGTAAQRAADRERLATLIGRLLAHRWLRRQQADTDSPADPMGPAAIDV
jgi:hypothetical protein